MSKNKRLGNTGKDNAPKLSLTVKAVKTKIRRKEKREAPKSSGGVSPGVDGKRLVWAPI